MSSQATTLDTCGCCEGVRPPEAISNPPGLAELAYRVGTHAAFKQRMEQALSRAAELRRLTRDDDDPAIALLDAWAVVLDVLSFYDERIANEGFLRTATETRSIRELARAIGYELRPGTAAATTLDFRLETAAGAPRVVTIRTGVKVQSVPGPGELPATFETVEEIEARPEWNELRASPTMPSRPAAGAVELYLRGVDSNLEPGDRLLFVGKVRFGAASPPWQLRSVQSVERSPDGTTTRVAWANQLGHDLDGLSLDPTQQEVAVYALRLRAALFGHNAPDVRAMPDAVRKKYRVAAAASEWPNLSLSGIRGSSGSSIFLDGLHAEVVEGSWIVLSAPSVADRLYSVTSAGEDARRDFTLASKTTRLDLAGPGLAPFEKLVRGTVVFARSERLSLAEWPITDPVAGPDVELAAPVPRLPEGRTLVVSGKRAHVVVSGAPSGIRVVGREQLAFSRGEVLELHGHSMDRSGMSLLRLGRREAEAVPVLVLARPQALTPVPAPDDAPVVSELARTGAQPAGDPQSTLRLAAPLSMSYDRASLRIAANVAGATHGESKHEVLGSGDASASFQRFTLKDAPLTYVPSSSAPGGAATTLSVRVNGVRWKEVRSLYGRGPRDRVYVVRITDDGKATIVFGDGVAGARVPTGVENVTGDYRVGSGLKGQVGAGRLTLLAGAPLGVRSVTNPFPASGADEPERFERARQNAPHTVLTFDRIVSLQDYEDFAAAFAGVGKAQAAWLWSGESRIVHLTVGGADGQPFAAGAVTLGDLRDAVAQAGEPRRLVRIESFEPLRFEVEARIVVDPDYEPAAVLAAVADDVRAEFAFERRAFAQSVAESEVVASIQRVPGVVAVEVRGLHLAGRPAVLNQVLPSLRARWEGGAIRPAQLLTVAPDAIRLARTT